MRGNQLSMDFFFVTPKDGTPISIICWTLWDFQLFWGLGGERLPALWMAPVPGPHEFWRRLFEPFREAEMALHYLVPGLFRVAWNGHSADQIVHFQGKKRCWAPRIAWNICPKWILNLGCSGTRFQFENHRTAWNKIQQAFN